MNKEELIKFWRNRWSWYLTYAEEAMYQDDYERHDKLIAMADQVMNCINELQDSAV